MINDIVNGISNAIYEQYGQNKKIYTENIEQGFTEPCFFIAVLETTQARYIGNRYKLTVPVNVHYFPSTKAKKREMQDVAQTLHYALQRITLADGDMLNGFKLHWEIVENVLHFFVTYMPIVKYDCEPETVMEDLTINSTVKAGD